MFNQLYATEPPSVQDLQLEEEWMEHTGGRRLPEGCKAKPDILFSHQLETNILYRCTRFIQRDGVWITIGLLLGCFMLVLG